MVGSMRTRPFLLASLLIACAPAATTPPTEAVAAPQPAPPEVETPAPIASVAGVGADPSINDSWRSSEIDPLVERLEGESREIYAHRERLAEVVAPAKGSVVADIGAGSGFMSLLFAKAVGPEGKVLSVDINATMLERLAKLATDEGVGNLETMLSEQEATPLAPDSVDLVFICDTYHHFESPATTLASIHAALRGGGELILVDFERIEGKSEEWMLKHVRAGKEVFRQEVVDAGFELVTEHELTELEDNYVLRFRKAS
jgi:predicted methyltransferase